MISLKKQLGLSLVELMIAGALGIGLTTAVINIVMISNKTSSQSDGLAQAQETGRFAASFLRDALKKAGYNGNSAHSFLPPHAAECANPALPVACTLDFQTGAGDRITVRRALTNFDDTDCTGVSLNRNLADKQLEEVIDVFWVEGNGIDEGELRCQTFREGDNAPLNNAQPIASGIIALHALYGHSTGTTDNGYLNVTRYVASTEIPLDPDDNQPQWGNIFSVKVAILVQSFEESSIKLKERGYILLDADPYRMTDQYSRQVFTTTVTRRNFNNLPNRENQ